MNKSTSAADVRSSSHKVTFSEGDDGSRSRLAPTAAAPTAALEPPTRRERSWSKGVPNMTSSPALGVLGSPPSSPLPTLIVSASLDLERPDVGPATTPSSPTSSGASTPTSSSRDRGHLTLDLSKTTQSSEAEDEAFLDQIAPRRNLLDEDEVRPFFQMLQAFKKAPHSAKPPMNEGLQEKQEDEEEDEEDDEDDDDEEVEDDEKREKTQKKRPEVAGTEKEKEVHSSMHAESSDSEDDNHEATAAQNQEQ